MKERPERKEEYNLVFINQISNLLAREVSDIHNRWLSVVQNKMDRSGMRSSLIVLLPKTVVRLENFVSLNFFFPIATNVSVRLGFPNQHIISTE